MRVTRKLRRRWIVLCVLLIGVIGLASQVEASDGMRGDRCVVGEDDVIVEDFYFFCRILEVRGTIDGDLLGVASNITIESTGVVTGDLWVAGGQVEIMGVVGDDVHFAGVTLSVSDKARFSDPRIDVLSIALNTNITQGAEIPGDLLVYGYQAEVNGTIGGDIDFGGEALIVNGVVHGRIDASVGDARRSTDLPGLPIYDVSFSNPGLLIGERAVIDGDLAYTSSSRSQIPPDVVQGTVNFNQSGSQPDITQAEQPEAAARIMGGYLVASVRDLISILLLGVVGLRLVPGFVIQPAQNVRRKLIPTVGWGLVAFMLSFPVAVILVVISLLALLILSLIHLTELSIVSGLGLFTLNLALIGGFWFLLLFMGRVVVSLAIGQIVYRYVLRIQMPGTFRRWVAHLAIGAVIYVLITNVPVPAVGLIIELVAALAGIGAVVMYVRSIMYPAQVAAEEGLPPAPVSANAVKMPPVPETREVPLGMQNLPEGFTGFDE